jgi:hypothetical protein
MSQLTVNLKTKPTNALGTKSVQVKESPPENCWRLVHDGIRVTHLFECSGKTWVGTNSTMFCSKDKTDCLKEIDRLGLKPLPIEEP